MESPEIPASPGKPARSWRLLWRKTPAVPEERRPSPEITAGFLSKLTFSWMGSLIATGFCRPLQRNDIPLLNPSRSVLQHIPTFDEHFAAARKSDDIKNPLLTALHKTVAREFWMGGLYRLVADLFALGSAYSLRYLIQFVLESYYIHLSQAQTSDEPPPLRKGIGLLAGIVAMQVLLSLFQNHFLYSGQMVGGQVRALLTAKILEKSMRISNRAKAGDSGSAPAALAATKPPEPEIDDCRSRTSIIIKDGEMSDTSYDDSAPTYESVEREDEAAADAPDEVTSSTDDKGWSNGRVINLVSTDAHRIDQCISMIHIVWTSPVIILICIALLIVNLSYSALSGLGCLVLLMIILLATTKPLFAGVQAIDDITDSRVSLTQEVLQAIRMIKYFRWEQSFLTRLTSIRARETRAVQRHMAIRNVVTALGQSLTSLAAMTSFVTFALGSGKQLNPAVIFSSAALFQSLLMPTAYLPGCIGHAVDAWGSIKRIEEYLLAEEVEELPVDEDMKDAICVRRAAFTWEQSQAAVATDGATAGAEVKASKASEAPESKGSQPAPFKLSSLSLNVHRGELLAVIGGIGSGKTSLLAGLAGDMRKVRGTVTFSSRPAYCPQAAWIQNATVRNNILFGAPYYEDWYDAVIGACQLRRDFHILPDGDATEIGEKGANLSGGQKQRVSLARAIYSRADVVLLDDPLSAVDAHVGQAIFRDAILGLLGGKTRILATHQPHVLGDCDRILWLDDGRVKALDTFATLREKHDEIGMLVKDAKQQRDDTAGGVSKAKSKRQSLALEKIPRDDALAPLMQDEDQTTDGISWSVYANYITSSRSRGILFLVLPLLCLAQGASTLSGLWLAWWVSNKFDMATTKYVAIYVCLPVASGLLFYTFGLCVSISSTSSSNAMLDAAIERATQAPTQFFDTTPLGRIANRFSKDVHTMDYGLPESLRLFMTSTALVVGIFALIVTYFHWFGVALAPFVVIFFFSAAYYRASAREMKRHESVLRSAVVARISETLTGVTAIRTYSMQSSFCASLQLAIDDMNSANFLTFSNQRWLALRLDSVGVLLIVTSGVLAIVDRFTQSPAISGLVLSYALSALQVLQFIVRQWADVENAMTATERIHAYGPRGSIPVEGNPGCPGMPVASSWPEHGVVTFSGVWMRYRSGLPCVLKDFSLTINPGEHIAVVGRTGAGKSSLIAALFRICEVSDGGIAIDGVDISQVQLGDLRSRISIQPQDSILFRGTVRSNLDPDGVHDDEKLWLALRDAWLGDTMHLDDAVDEEGANLSHGQRQLLGLARLLVRDSKVVVCDEATSSVDLETDAKIQRTVASSFRDKTVLTVAHRIRSIIHYDKVCVMDQGRVLELGTPTELWALGGRFRSMCDASGITEKEVYMDWLGNFTEP